VADGTDPSLSERVRFWSARWDGGDCAADSGENAIEGACVLACAVTDHEPDCLVIAHSQVPGGLSCPCTGWVGCDSGEVHPSGIDLDEKQHMKPSQRDGIDAEEIGRYQGVGLAGNELAPRRPGPVRGGLTSSIAQNLLYRRHGYRVSETSHLTVDAPVPPVRVLRIEAQHQPTKLSRGGWPPGSGHRWLGPMSSDETSMPADHRRRFDDQHHLAQSSAIECTRQHGEDSPVGWRELRPIDLAL